MTPKQYVDQSLTFIDSENCKAWVNCDQNRPIFEQAASIAIKNDRNIHVFTTWILCEYIGL